MVWLLRGLLCVGGAAAVYLHSNGVHTDVVVPLRNEVFDWTDWIRPEHSRSGAAGAAYAAIGWGNRRFYLQTRHWDDLNAATAISALSGLDDSLLHVTFLAVPPPSGSQRVRLVLSQAEYGRLVRQIVPYFRKGADGAALPVVGEHYDDNDVFYEAEGRYHLFYTCNTWVNERLKNSGLKAVLWTPFAYSVLAAYD